MIPVSRLTLLSSLIALLWIEPVFAQEVVTVDSLGEQSPVFEKLLREGIENRRQGRDARAATLFKQALAQAPGSVRAQVHLATAYHALGDWLGADELLTSALAKSSDPFVVKHQAALQRETDLVRDHIGQLQVMGGLPGAEVRINGRLLGKLPMKEPQRVIAGAYRLEVTQPGYYPVQREITIGARADVREQVELVELSEGGGPDGRKPLWAPRWVPWTLGVAAGAGAATAAVGLYERERHARLWNQCTEGASPSPLLSREQICPGQRRLARQAEQVFVVGGSVAGVLAVGAVITAVVRKSEPTEGEQAGVGCSLGWGAVVCNGRF
jgi:hypothetical protein